MLLEVTLWGVKEDSNDGNETLDSWGGGERSTFSYWGHRFGFFSTRKYRRAAVILYLV